MITLDEALESAKLSAGKERILRQQHYEDLVQQLPEEERYAFTMALVELDIGPRTGGRASEKIAAFLRDELKVDRGLSDRQIEDRIVRAAFRKNAQWWEKLKQKFQDWTTDEPLDEYEEEFGEPFPYREPGTEDLYPMEPEEIIGPEPPPEPEPTPEEPMPEPEPEISEPEPEDLPAPPTEFPDMIPVNSSNLEAVGYDAEENLLYIMFKAKRRTPQTLYMYFDVSPEEFQGLLDADSKGQYFHQNIRETKNYTKLDLSAVLG